MTTRNRAVSAGPMALGLGLMMEAIAMGKPASQGSRLQVSWDNYSDTWVATDALGRRVATHEDTGPPRPDRWVGIFYFLWHGAHVNGGPWDITRIRNTDPEAMQKKDSCCRTSTLPCRNSIPRQSMHTSSSR